MPIKNFTLGTAIQITSTINIDTLTNATITILDSNAAIVINKAAMSKSANKVYSYIYQTLSTGSEGLYTARIEATHGIYTSVCEEQFEMVEQSH